MLTCQKFPQMIFSKGRPQSLPASAAVQRPLRARSQISTFQFKSLQSRLFFRKPLLIAPTQIPCRSKLNSKFDTVKNEAFLNDDAAAFAQWLTEQLEKRRKKAAKRDSSKIVRCHAAENTGSRPVNSGGPMRASEVQNEFSHS